MLYYVWTIGIISVAICKRFKNRILNKEEKRMMKKKKRDVRVRLIVVLCVGLILGGYYTDSFGVCMGLLFGGVGIVALWWTKTGAQIVHKGVTACVGAILTTMGVGMIVASAGYHFLNWPADIDFGVFALGAGALIMLGGLFDTYKIFSCTELIEATCVNIKEVRARYGVKLYLPMYQFEWEGKRYQTQSGNSYFKRGVRKIVEGQRCCIYMNPKNPLLVRESRMPSLLFVAMAVFGVMIIKVAAEEIFLYIM